MKRAIPLVIGGILLLVAGLFVADAALPHDYRVQRQHVVQAPPDAVWPHVAVLPNTEAWSPFLASEESFENTYGPTTEGVGASYVWTGEPGWGRYEVVEVEPGVRQVAHLYSPSMGHTVETLILDPMGDGTQVTWSFEGTAEGIGSGFLVLFMDGLLGPMFEDGLSRLDEVVSTEEPSEEPAMQFEQYAFVLLKKGPNWSAEETPENIALQKGHLAHFEKMIAAGKMKMAGPFSDRVDEDLRGLCLYGTSVEEARELANDDPRVQAGHLVVEVMTLWTKAGALAFPLAEEVAASPKD